MLKLTLIFSLFLSSAGYAAPLYKTYKEWKDSQVAYWNVQGKADIAKDLTMADYFAGYLTRQNNQAEAIKQVSSRLSAGEVAELMTIYANSVFGSQASGLPAQADNSPKLPGK